MKSDIERGPFGAWAFHSRDQLDITVEDVASRLGYHPASLRKVESGSAPASRRMVRELPALYRSLATEKGVALSPAPAERTSEPVNDNAALAAAIAAQTQAIQAQTRVLDRLVDLLEGTAESPVLGRLGAGLVATAARLSSRDLEDEPSPAGGHAEGTSLAER